jgi:hypothetical protein
VPDEDFHMIPTQVAHVLYPVVLALANIGLGLLLQETGMFVLALILWVAGVLVLIGFVSSAGQTVVTSFRPSAGHPDP